MFSKRSQGILNQSNIEILARTRPGQMARKVTLLYTRVQVFLLFVIITRVIVIRIIKQIFFINL